MKILLFIFCFISVSLVSQTQLPATDKIDVTTLNKHLLNEINKIRRAAKVSELVSEPLLAKAANDHVNYMFKNSQLTHFQNEKSKKTAKNRVDFYGEQFGWVDENILKISLSASKRKPVRTYEALAKEIISSIVKHPDRTYHENLIRAGHQTTYTGIAANENGVIYLCQLLGPRAYIKNTNVESLIFTYKPIGFMTCFWCNRRSPQGYIYLTEDNSIMYSAKNKRLAKKGLGINGTGDGLAADILLKSQYSCDSGAAFNGKTNIKGIPLEPVLRKDFNRNGNSFSGKVVNINLGQVPDWIDEEFEVNLTVINKKRPCSNIMFKNLDRFFNLNLNVGLYIDSLSDFYQILEYDTSTYKISYEKSEYKIDEILLDPVKTILSDNRATISRIELTGFSSIEGSTETNQTLYRRRANIILKKLSGLGVDPGIIEIFTEENFREFRRDIMGTEFESLAILSDTELKAKVNSGDFVKKLEPYLAKHRYSEITVYTQRTKDIKYDHEKLYEQFNYYVSSNTRSECRKMQSIEYNLALKGDITVDQIKSFYIPVTKRYKNLLHDRALMIYQLDSLNPNARKNFEIKMEELKRLDKEHTRINTSLAVLNYSTLKSYRLAKKFYKELDEMKDISPVILARMKLNLAAKLDWNTARKIPTKYAFLFYYDELAYYIKTAKLSPDETVDVARYFAYFSQYDAAYKLIRKSILKTKSRTDKIFFLKLLYFTNLNISENTRSKHLRQIHNRVGDEFCTYFNSPDLNFQIFELQKEVFRLYCKECQ